MAINNIDVSIASSALNLVGIDAISSFEEGTTQANVANNLYGSIVEGALTLTRWRFATGQQTLSRLVATPEARWDAAYQVPSSPPILPDIQQPGPRPPRHAQHRSPLPTPVHPQRH